MPKEQSKKITPSQPSKISSTPKRQRRRYKYHPLEAFVKVDKIPITMHPSPLNLIHFTHNSHRKQAAHMELKLFNFLWDMNSPCNGPARTRLPIGECKESVFDMYMCKTMGPEKYVRAEQYSPWINREGDIERTRHIIYEFNYPNFPSFGDGTWAKNYMNVDQKHIIDSLRKRFNRPIRSELETVQYRYIASKLIISYDTSFELYYAHLSHWVQSKNGDCWIESF